MADLDDMDAVEVTDELTLLKQRADVMGIQYHPSIGVESLTKKVDAKLKPDLEDEPKAKQDAENSSSVKKYSVQELIALQRTKLRNEALKLVRVRITCMNPDKKSWQGELFDIGNSVLGSVKKFVPFNVDAGYHVPNIIYEHIKQRKYQKHFEVKTSNGRKITKSSLVPEFAVEMLDPLTKTELKELADRQILNHSIDA